MGLRREDTVACLGGGSRGGERGVRERVKEDRVGGGERERD